MDIFRFLMSGHTEGLTMPMWLVLAVLRDAEVAFKGLCPVDAVSEGMVFSAMPVWNLAKLCELHEGEVQDALDFLCKEGLAMKCVDEGVPETFSVTERGMKVMEKISDKLKSPISH